MTNFLGSEVYGNISFALALSATFNVFGDLGFGSAHIKKISEGKGIDTCVSTYAVVKIVLTFVTVVVSIIAIVFWMFFLGGNLTGVTTNLVLLFVLYQVFYNLSGIATQTYYATMEQTKAQIISLTDPLIRVPLIAIIVLGGMGAIEIAYAYVLCAISILLVGFYFLKRDKIKWGRPALFSSYLSFALPLVFVSIVWTVASNMDKLFLGFFWDYGSVGYYSASFAFTGFFGIVGTAVAVIAFPSFSKLHAEGRVDLIQLSALKAERYISIMMMPVMTLIIVFPSEITRIFLGSGMEIAGESMRYLAVAVLISLINTGHSSQILAVNRPDLTAIITLLYFATLAFLLTILVPKEILGLTLFGMNYNGAALAMLITSIIIFLVTRVVVYTLTRTGSNPKILMHIVAASITGLLVFLLSRIFAISNVFDLIMYGLLTLGLFLGLLASIREFRKDDVLYFLDIANVKKMKDHMSNELKKSK